MTSNSWLNNRDQVIFNHRTDSIVLTLHLAVRWKLLLVLYSLLDSIAHIHIMVSVYFALLLPFSVQTFLPNDQRRGVALSYYRLANFQDH